MNLIRFLLILSIILQFNIKTNAQDDILNQLKAIKVISSTRKDVEKILGKGEDKDIWTFYYYSNESVQITYSNGKCSGGWLAPKNHVIRVRASFLEDRKLSELKKKVNLKKLKFIKAYDVPGEKAYYDDVNGIEYNINDIYKTWSSVTYYPSSQFKQFSCED